MELGECFVGWFSYFAWVDYRKLTCELYALILRHCSDHVPIYADFDDSLFVEG